MNIAGVIHDATNGYDGIAIEIYFSGCTRNCKGCHNPQMQNFEYGKPLNIEELLKHLHGQEDWFDIISFLGGDLLCQEDDEANLLTYVIRKEFPNKELWLFTGETQENIPRWCLEFFDVIKVGSYIQELYEQGYELASKNQKFIKKGVDY